jgi:hypothetical protein
MLLSVPTRISLPIFATCLVLAGSVNALGRQAAATTGVPCGPPRASTVVSDRVARVYVRKGNVFGCARDGGKSYKLGTTQNSMSEGRAGPIEVAGTDAAYGLTNYGVDTASAQVVVRRLTDGRVLRQEHSISGPEGAESFESVDRVVVKRDGSVAWIAHATSIAQGHHSVTEVQKSDQTQRTLLDKSDQIRAHSLRLKGSRLSWIDGAARKYATLR